MHEDVKTNFQMGFMSLHSRLGRRCDTLSWALPCFNSSFVPVHTISSLRARQFKPSFHLPRQRENGVERTLNHISMYTPKAKKYKESSDVGFCMRQRQFHATTASRYSVEPGSFCISEWNGHQAFVASLAAESGDRNRLRLVIIPLKDGMFRFVIDDLNPPLHDRYHVKDVVLEDVYGLRLKESMLKVCADHATITVADGRDATVHISFSPFCIVVRDDSGDRVLARINPESQLAVEDFGVTKTLPDIACGAEQFLDFVDSKPRGPESVGVDVSFPNATNLHGIPERTCEFSLPDTIENGVVASEPFRLYNLDVAYYELDKSFGLYGSIPFLFARDANSENKSVGMFWHNASETYVDTWTTDEGKATHWYSESGLLDLFILPGSTPLSVYNRYLSLTGKPMLPPLFSLGYHQCRYSYMSAEDIRYVNRGFLKHDIPVDTIWFDIDYTDGKRYFTWNKETFPDGAGLQYELAESGRRSVLIIDPHIKVDATYAMYNTTLQEEMYVRNKDGDMFVGKSWPGDACYIDFTSPHAQEMWSKQHNPKPFPGLTPHTHIWNDMNEPSVANGPEISMQKDALHACNTEHRHIHNLYGYLQARATHTGLHNLRGGRNFVLTRSFFAGIQRYAAVWTGDNDSTWGHLRGSIAMNLSVQICGVGLSGADVGGFFGNPDAQLVTRWFQAAAWQAFFRGHSCRGTRRREPWDFGEPFTSAIRACIKARYAFLRYWYTEFARATGAGGLVSTGPVMRAIWWEFAGVQQTHAWMVGCAVYTAPILNKDADVHVVDAPGGSWYDWFDGWKRRRGRFEVDAGLERMVVLVREGHILGLIDTTDMRSTMDWEHKGAQKYSIVVACDADGCASGELYFDDGDGVAVDGNATAWAVTKLRFDGKTLRVSTTGEYGSGAAVVTDVQICGWSGARSVRVELKCGEETKEVMGESGTCGVLRVQVDSMALTCGGCDWTMRIV